MISSLKEPWFGFLAFTLENRLNKTVVTNRKHFGPLVLQRAYYQETARATILVIHPPGGLVAGDRLLMQVDMHEGAKTLISTPAATKFYRSNGPVSCQRQVIKVSKNCQLEWLPQETLFYKDCNVRNSVVFNLGSDECELIAWDIVGFGRPHKDEFFTRGELIQKVEVNLCGKPIFIDNFYIESQSNILNNPLGLNGSTLMATMIFYHSDKSCLESLRKTLALEEWAEHCGISLVGSVLVLRTLDHDLDHLKARLICAWNLARPLIIGEKPILPRIWKT